jgi:hypothetical protein
MRSFERFLDDELSRVLDRVAADTPRGAVPFASTERPELRAEIETLEARACLARAELLARYQEWRQALDAYAEIWATVALESVAVPADLDRQAA